jgi:hypothetical protein
MAQTRLRPTFAELPLNPDDPPYSARGLWGVDDEVGTLVNSDLYILNPKFRCSGLLMWSLQNLLDEDSVTLAARDIRLGHRFSLE